MSYAIKLLVSQGLSFGLMLVGDSLLAKWLSLMKYYYWKYANPVLLMKMEQEYQKLLKDFESHKDDDKPL